MSDRIRLVLVLVTAALFFTVPGPVPAASPDPLESLAWLAGDWSGVDERGVLNEERWMEPAGGMMLAVHRDIANGKAAAFEFLRIEKTAEGIVYFASPDGKPATPFVLKESGPRRVVFENAQIAFPKRVLYRLEETGDLRARIEGSRGGKPMHVEWLWKRRGGGAR
ncbi:MAG: DUF6265 family protein [Acidobacteriota bacterium]